MPRNRTIDFVKGVLICFVLLGHLFVTPLVESPWKWMIYGFHMPLFLGISGYLFVAPENFTLRICLKRYGQRMLLPWAVALVFYTTVFVPVSTTEGLVYAILHPWYHLWFVPVLFAYLCISTVTLSRGALFAISFLITVISQLILGFLSYPGYGEQLPHLLKKVLPWIGDYRLYTLCVFFFCGSCISSVAPALKRPTVVTWLAVGCICGFSSWIHAYGSTSFLVICGAYLLLNLSILGCMPVVFSTLQLRNYFLEHLGRESLYYYLWHPLFFMAFKRFLYPVVDWPSAFILTFGITLAVLYGVLAALQRSNNYTGITTALGITRVVTLTD